jgi:hypothetical protein
VANNDLESVREAIRYYHGRKEITSLSLQPKYMGSRCQIYLDLNDISRSYAVTRNGYVIRDLDLSGIYSSLANNISCIEVLCKPHIVGELSMVIFDGELMPWSALGLGLIEEVFETIQYGVKSESEAANANTTLTKLPKYYHSYDAAEQKSDLDAYAIQVQMYGAKDVPIHYKPFAILKIIPSIGDEIIISPYQPIVQFEVCQRIIGNVDDHCVLFEDETLESKINKANEFFNRLTMPMTGTSNTVFEGIVIKPQLIDPKIMAQHSFAPCLKVRNSEYLRIIYGYDYQQKDKYSKLIKSKRTDSKIKRSIYEANLMQELLIQPFASLSSDNVDAQNILYKFLKESNAQIDPRL